MEEIPVSEVDIKDSECFYLPHHAVVKAESTTTKLRVVFDASSASSTGMSLNDRLLAGPNVNQDLFSVFLRFRANKVAFAADVEKMYRQVLVHPLDRNFQRIVWRSNPEEPIKHYRLCTVTYGTKSAPFLAIEALKQAAREYQTVFPEAARRIEMDTYVDDFLSGAKNIEEARELKNQATEILHSAGFNLRKWTTNCPELLCDEADGPESVDVKWVDQPDTVMALGIRWLPQEDVFSFKIFQPVSTVNTKRQLLSDSSKLFDPFGWISPVTIRIKILFQQLWLYDMSWDDQLPPVIESMWTDIKQQLCNIEQVRIPRFAANYNRKMELHGFSDASEMAYGAVVYSRSRDENGKIVITLLAAKTRVAPIKQVTLPRLELSAAALLTELMKQITNAFSNLQLEHWAWTDSSIVLDWLSAHPRKWQTFIGNRTSVILNFLPRDRWNHVSSQENPADCASRGLNPEELVTHRLWFHGPEWLGRDVKQWNSFYIERIDKESTEDCKVESLHATILNVRTSFIIESELLRKRSSFTVIVRTLAYINRVIQVSKKLRSEGELTPSELYQAKIQLAQTAQHDIFDREIELLRQGKEIPFSPLNKLHPFMDDGGTLRVGGRLQFAPYSYDIKHPIILPRDHRVTELLILDLHLRNFHAGRNLLSATINQQYWVVGLSTAIRRVTDGCIRCVRLKGKTATQLMGNLPVPRVTATRAFTHVGVDYAGPIKINASCVRGIKTTKGYVAVFICFSTISVHLGVASDLSTNVFIGALKRFIARRGYPSEIWSDNGTNFVGADRWLQELKGNLTAGKTEINRCLTNSGIKWVFNPPASPHRGGIWEAAVKSAKKHLVAVLGTTAVTYEEMSTILSQIEACLNSRPLCPLSRDPDSYEALTPGHFLIGQPLNLIPEPDLRYISSNRLDKWKLLQKQTVEIWRRWRDEYLSNLQLRTKWQITKANVQENQLVLVKNDNAPPTQWELARVKKVHPDSVGIVRTVTLQRGQAEYQRPIQRICLLPPDAIETGRFKAGEIV
ncbi:uncharacterized protein LOC129729231 [Wyeomyia smithii]|uniref:uncharacterized protein LOC129729231 n=1 Tax=Wyeomyia smithii TaxID=174621 RepID=UPI002467DA52|nr:uncharacterized protein LOC129729231 [Wyeomyia smithii]